MNPLQWFITLAGIAGDSLTVAGQDSLGKLFYNLGKLAESGGDVEAHMAGIKAKLDAGPVTDADWDDVHARIDADQAAIDNA